MARIKPSAHCRLAMACYHQLAENVAEGDREMLYEEIAALVRKHGPGAVLSAVYAVFEALGYDLRLAERRRL